MAEAPVSLIVLVDGPTRLLDDALASVATQTWPNLDPLAVCPEHRADEVAAAARRLSFDGLRIVTVDAGATLAAMLAAGLPAARGDHVAWLGSCDACDPRRVESQMAARWTNGTAAVTACLSRLAGACDDAGGLPAGSRDAPPWPLVDGTLDPRTLLVSRAVLEATGAVDPSFGALSEHELALRIAAGFPIRTVPRTLLRRHVPPEFAARPAEFAADVAQFWRRHVELLTSAPEVRDSERATKATRGAFCTLDTFGRAASPELVEEVRRELVDPNVSIVRLDARAHAALAQAHAAAGVGATPARSLARQALVCALDAVATPFVLIAEPGREPEPVRMVRQYLTASGADLAACLPVGDVTFGKTAGSLIPGVLFRTAVLRNAVDSLGRGETHFWNAFTQHGRVGALPRGPEARAREAGGATEDAPFVWPLPLSSAEPPRSDGGDAAHEGAQPAQPAPPASTPEVGAEPAREFARRLVDFAWYRGRYSDVAATGLVPALHYERWGWREGRDPNPWFDTAWYLARHPGLADAGVCPLVNFAETGDDPSRYVNAEWYASRYLRRRAATREALAHFLAQGFTAGAVPDPCLDRRPIREALTKLPPGERIAEIRRRLDARPSRSDRIAALVEPDWYLEVNPDVAEAGIDPVAHFLADGVREGRNPNRWFDTDWYLRTYLARIRDGEAALEHFLRVGASLGCRPGPGFAIDWYARRYLGWDSPGAEALVHFMIDGLASGALPDPRLDSAGMRRRLATQPPHERQADMFRLLQSAPTPRRLIALLVDPAWYLARNSDVAAAGIDPVAHFLADGVFERRDPNPMFDSAWYTATHAAAMTVDDSPVEHFVFLGAHRGLRPHPDFATHWYSTRYLGLDSPVPDALCHFLETGRREGAVPNPHVDADT